MKYLKPFSLNENAGSLFTKTNHDTWVTMHWYNEEEFTDQELGQIKQHFKNWYIDDTSGKLFVRGLYHKGKNNKGFRIMKTADEWYYVFDMHAVDLTNKYYKCDQMEGLISCLEHCISIQKEKDEKIEKEIKQIRKKYPRASRDTIIRTFRLEC